MDKVKYIFWDFDGTLAYRDGMWTDTLLSVLHNNGITIISKEHVKPFLNTGFTWHSPEIPHSDFFHGMKWWEYYEKYFSDIFQKLGISGEQSKKMSKEVRAEYLNIAKWHVYDDVENALIKLSNKKYVHIILSNHVPELLGLVKKLKIDMYFEKVYSSANIGYEKPNSKIFDYVTNDLRTDKTNCIMIGDSYESDIVGALNSGIEPILVRKENKKNYQWYCQSLKDITKVIKCLDNHLTRV